MLEALIENLPWVVGLLGLFSYLTVSNWSKHQRLEREALYRAEAIKKIAEMGPNVSEPVLKMLRDALTGTTDPQPGVYAPHAYYRHLTLQKIMESSSEGGQAAMAFLREQDLANKRKTRDGLMLGGAICFVVGVALMIFLNVIVAQPVYLVGLFPLAVGIVLCGAGYVYRPAEH